MTYNLRQIVELTGVSEYTLRGWETRYAALSPKRSDTGRRIYQAKDILRTRALTELVSRGKRISEIARLSLLELQSLLAADVPSQEKSPKTPAAKAIQKIMKSADAFQWDPIKVSFRVEQKKLTRSEVFFQLLLPLIAEMNQRVKDGHFTIAQEHIFSALIKEEMLRLRLGVRKKRSSLRVILAAPEGDFHELGLVAAHTLADLGSVNTLYIGPNMPKRELCETAIRFKASHIILVSTLSKKEGAQEELTDYIHFLDRHLPKDCSLWAAGRNSNTIQLKLEREFSLLKSFKDLKEKLKTKSLRGKA